MAERQAWFCPACQKHHAPHCDSCPNPTVEVRPIPGVNVWPTVVMPLPVTPYVGDPMPSAPYWTATGICNVPFDPTSLCVYGAVQ